jgi:transcriptional regulator of acetoin/glycerol metabolism
MALFERHPWPGNLRQLSSVLQIALAMADDQPIQPEHLPDDFFADLQVMDAGKAASQQAQLSADGDDEDDLASQFQACGGNISHLARRLGVSRNTLYKRLREQGLRE